MAEMNEQIQGIQAEQDKGSKVGRIEADEKSMVGGPAASAPPASAKTAIGAPRSVQLGGDDTGENEDPNDPTARPEIKVQGQGGGATMPTRPNGRRVRSGDDGTSGGGASSATDPDAKKAYDNALQLVNQHQNDRALEALNAFLVKWPDHPYAENAMYWRGEIYFAQGEYLRAAEQFEAVVNRFNGRKAPDALLKIGLCHEKLGAPTRAQDYWARLKRDYPQSDAARKIPKETR